MHIHQDISQFHTQRALFVVCGKTTANLLYANEGTIDVVDSFRTRVPEYSDNEGFTMRHTKSGVLYKAGGLKKNTTDLLLEENFLDTLNEKVVDLLNRYNITDIYLFSPGHTTKKVRESWPVATQKLVRRSIRGNYTKHHAMKLVQKISTPDKKNNSRKHNKNVSQEASKIYKTFHQRNSAQYQ